ncbi:LOW QUALITY PROTEIN: coiled-coil domain-containing protein 33 [Discoglossus pictus]
MPAPTGPSGPPRLQLHDKLLALDFHLLDAQFNEPGRYQLVLRVENPLLDGSVDEVKLRVNHGDIINSNQAESDIAEQGDLTETLTFQKNTYLFILPKGLCKNDKQHDVRLCIDVLKYASDDLHKGRQVGQALFAIYPRTNQPRINLRAGPFQPLYNYQGVLALLRVGGDKLAMHCGRLAYSVCFREYQPPIEDIPKHPSPRPATLKPTISHNGTPIPAGTSDPATLVSTPSQLDTHRSDSDQSDTHRTSTQPDTHFSGMQLHESETPGMQPPQATRLEIRTPSPETDSLQEQEELTDGLDDSPSHSPLVLVTKKIQDDAPLVFPSPPETPPSKQKSKVLEKPPAQTEPVNSTDGGFSVLSPSGTETVSVTLHSASHLPTTTAGSVPSPYITLTSGSDKKNGVRAQSISHATENPTHNPAWGETLTMTVSEKEAEQEELILTVADSPSQDLLLSYRLPLRDLLPFHIYHLCMVQQHKQVTGGCLLYASLMRKTSHIPRQNGFTYSALQVLLGGVEAPLQKPGLPLLAVARIVPNYTDYTDYRQSQKPPGVCGVTPITVTFPNPSPSCFKIPSGATHGHPQISSRGLPCMQPVWNSSFLFQGRDGVTLFSEGAALLLEYYPVTADSKRVPWHLSDCCGFSVVPLDMQVYHQLMSDGDSLGYNINRVAIQGTDLRTLTGESPTVSLQLLLLKSEHPESFLGPLKMQQPSEWHPMTDQPEPPTQGFTGPSSMEQHPRETLRDPSEQQSNADQPESSRKGLTRTSHTEELQRHGPSLPPHHALAEILPNPWGSPAPREQAPPREQNSDSMGIRRQPPTNTFTQYLSNDMELPADPVMAHQEQELANYRLAMQRMADDIITLRRQLGALEAENSALRSERSLHQDAGRSLLSDTDLDVMTKAELADRLVTLKQKLASETSELRGMRDRIQQLQNELVRRNDREKELLLLQRAHQQQQTVLHQYHERLNRAKTLQDTIRKQEKVIEKMEKLLDNKLKEEKKSRTDAGQKGGRVETLQGEIHAALLSENSRLREELEKARQPVITIQQSAPDTFSDSEKFSLLSKLEKSQARVQSLERELEEAARRWGRDKQQLLTRLSEQEMGFSRTHTTILHHFPTKESAPPSRRHAKLDPLI